MDLDKLESELRAVEAGECKFGEMFDRQYTPVFIELVRRVRAAEGSNLRADEVIAKLHADINRLLAESRAALANLQGIVRDLAASNPVQGIYNGGHEVETCALCGATGEFEDEYLTKLRIEHKPSCLKRRAVEASKP